MKGFNTVDGYMGLVDGKYILFASESDYYEYMKSQFKIELSEDFFSSSVNSTALSLANLTVYS